MIKIIEQMIKDRNLSFWSATDLQDYIKKPVTIDNNYNAIFDEKFQYSEDEKEAIESVAAMERGTSRG